MIGRRIKALRNNLKRSQEWVAEQSNTTRQTIHRYETGEITNIPSDRIEKIAKALNVTPGYLMGWEDNPNESLFMPVIESNDYAIPLLASVPCGEPYEAIEDSLDNLYINTNLYNKGVRYALIADGDSMYPKIEDGDTILIKPTPQVDSGVIAIVKVNQHDVTCKKVLINENGITLIPLNTNHEAVMYSMQEVLDLPVTIIGRVMEVRKIL